MLGNCEHCPLRGLPTVETEGPRDARIAFIAEAPGENEERQGRPLVGWSGQLFNAALTQAGLRREECLVGNAAQERPRDAHGKNAPPPKQAIAARRDRLLKEIGDCAVVVAMGEVAVRTIAPEAFIGPHGRPRGITSIRGYPVVVGLTDSKPRVLVPTVHPAFCLRVRNWTPLFFADIKKAVNILTDGFKQHRPPTFIAQSVADVLLFARHVVGRRISVDTETTRAHPMQARLKCIGISCCCADCLESKQPRNIVIPHALVIQKEVHDILRKLFDCRPTDTSGLGHCVVSDANHSDVLKEN